MRERQKNSMPLLDESEYIYEWMLIAQWHDLWKREKKKHQREKKEK